MGETYQHLERRALPLTDLEEDPLNPKIYTDAQIEERVRQITVYGQPRDILVRVHATKKKLVIVGGHRTYRAMRVLRWATAWCTIATEWTEVQAHGFMLIDNMQPAADDHKLLDVYTALQADDYDLTLVGVDEDDIAALRAMLDTDGAVVHGEPRGRAVTTAQQAQHVVAVLYMPQVDLLEQALKKTGHANRGAALAAICQAFLDHDWIPGDEPHAHGGEEVRDV